MSFIYVASPYSDPDPAVRFHRYNAVGDFIQSRIRRDNHPMLYSPIVHWAPLAEKYDFPTHYEFWKRIDHSMINAAEAVWVLRLQGWKNSLGVTSEIAFAREANKPVVYVDYDPD